jgi:hypothetical protein
MILCVVSEMAEILSIKELGPERVYYVHFLDCKSYMITMLIELMGYYLFVTHEVNVLNRGLCSQ